MPLVNNYWELDAIDEVTTMAWSVLKQASKECSRNSTTSLLNNIIAKHNHSPTRLNIIKDAQTFKRKRAATITSFPCNTRSHQTVKFLSIALSSPKILLKKKKIKEQKRKQREKE